MSHIENADGPRRSQRQPQRSKKVMLEEYSSTLTKLEEISYESTKEYTTEQLKEYAGQVREIYNQYAIITKELKQNLIKEKANSEILELLKEFKENKHDTSRVLNGVNEQLIKLGDQPVDNIAVSEAGSIASQQDLMERFLQDIEQDKSWDASIPRMSPTPSVVGQTPPRTPVIIGAEGFTPINHVTSQSFPAYTHIPTSQYSNPDSQLQQQNQMLKPYPPAPPPLLPLQLPMALHPQTMLQPPSVLHPPTMPPPPPPPPPMPMSQPPPGFSQARVSFADPPSAPYQGAVTSAEGISQQFRNISMVPNSHVPLSINNVVSPNISSMNDCNPSISMSVYNSQTFSPPIFTPTSAHCVTTPNLISPMMSHNILPHHYAMNPISAALDHTPINTADIAVHHLLKQGLYNKDIAPFDGSAHLFSGWVSKLRSKVTGIKLTPSEVLNLLIGHSVGEPKKYLNEVSSGNGEINQVVLDSIFEKFREKFGSVNDIFTDLMLEINKFPNIKYNHVELFERINMLCQRIEYNMTSCPDLISFNTKLGLERITCKLPLDSLKRWTKVYVQYQCNNRDAHPPLHVFREFLSKEILFYKALPSPVSSEKEPKSRATKVCKTEVSTVEEDTSNCLMHKNAKHFTKSCNEFLKLTPAQREKKAIDNNTCTRCLVRGHSWRTCDSDVRCDTCGGKHLAVMHNPKLMKKKATPGKDKYEEKPRDTEKAEKSSEESTSKVLSLKTVSGKSCSRTGLVDLYFADDPNNKIRGYAIIDDQASSCLITSDALRHFGRRYPVGDYSLETANGIKTIQNGELVTGLVVQGIDDRRNTLELPLVKRADHIPDCSEEVATPSLVARLPHVAEYAEFFSEKESGASTILIIGRSCGAALELEVFGDKSPWIYKTPLFYSLVGEVCEENSGSKSSTRVFKTQEISHEHVSSEEVFFKPEHAVYQEDKLFRTYLDDESQGLSTEDRTFLKIMEEGVRVTPEGSMEAPLPFKDKNLPANRTAVLQRTRNTLKRMSKSEPEVFQKCMDIMQDYISKGEMEIAPALEVTHSDQLVGYLPYFVVFHPVKRKPRLVFDAKASYKGSSINDHLLSGPDLTNELRAVLLRFREKPIAVVGDIQGMFHKFQLPEQHRDALRFFWPKDSCADQLIELRPTCHIFGLCSSPSVASYCLKKIGQEASDFSEEARNFIEWSFYVDDCPSSFDDVESAVTTFTQVREILKRRNINLHQIISNSEMVLNAFPVEERSKACFSLDDPMCQRTLGVMWNALTDNFTIDISIQERAFTKRGILATINAIYDPEGYVAPVTLGGKLFQREVLPPQEKMTPEIEVLGWDDPLPDHFRSEWQEWTSSLQHLSAVSIPRCFIPYASDWKQELHAYCDASDKAIGWTLYMRSENSKGEIHVALVVACSKVAPRAANTTPRLELCSAAGAAQCTIKVLSELSNKPATVKYHSDSQIVLGYIRNTSKRFKRYIERRVAIILNTSKPEQWLYVRTDVNPADLACRPQKVQDLLSSRWFVGPETLWTKDASEDCEEDCHDLPEEVKKDRVMNTRVENSVVV